MKRKLFNKSGLSIFTLMVLTFLLTACPKKKTDPTPATPGTPSTPSTPVATTITVKLSKNWGAISVSEDGTVVFTNSNSSNIKPGYGNFKIDLRSQNAAKLTEYDGKSFTGTWSISSDEKTLTVTGLTPQPTDTGGTIVFTINEITDSSMKITRTSKNRKTGATTTIYTLTII